VITSWHVIEHVRDVRDTLAEWYRVLKPGGWVMIETPIPGGRTTSGLMRAGAQTGCYTGKPVHDPLLLP